MEEIFVVESNDDDLNVQVENFWQTLTEAEAFVQARFFNDNIDYKRNKDEENDSIIRYWNCDDKYICIRVTVVE